MALLAATGGATAEPCDADGASLGAAGASASAGAGEACPEPGTRGRFIEAGVIAAGHRLEATWETWDTPYGRETTLAVSLPPRFLVWHEDAYGCSLAANVAGTTWLPCVAGGPPEPPMLP